MGVPVTTSENSTNGMQQPCNYRRDGGYTIARCLCKEICSWLIAYCRSKTKVKEIYDPSFSYTDEQEDDLVNNQNLIIDWDNR